LNVADLLEMEEIVDRVGAVRCAFVVTP